MAKAVMTVEITYDDRLDIEAGYIITRIKTKVDKVLKELCKEAFSSTFSIEPVDIKQKEKSNAKSTRR